MHKKGAFSFYVEAVLLVLVLLVCASILVEVLGAARGMSRSAQQLSGAVRIAQNAAEQLAASDGTADFAALLGAQQAPDGALVAVYDAGGQPLTQEEEAAFTLRCECSETPAGPGTMLRVRFTVTAGQAVVYELDSQKYLRA